MKLTKFRMVTSEDWNPTGICFKCKCIHYGYDNKQYDYCMGNERIETTHEQRDLGVIITETLDVTKQCVRAANKAITMLDMINRAFKQRRYNWEGSLRNFFIVGRHFSTWSAASQADECAASFAWHQTMATPPPTISKSRSTGSFCATYGCNECRQVSRNRHCGQPDMCPAKHCGQPNSVSSLTLWSA